MKLGHVLPNLSPVYFQGGSTSASLPSDGEDSELDWEGGNFERLEMVVA